MEEEFFACTHVSVYVCDLMPKDEYDSPLGWTSVAI